MRESEVKQLIRLDLRDERGLVLYNNPSGVAVFQGGARVPYGLTTGAADLIGWYCGRFVAIETKAPTGGRNGEDQIRFIELARRHGCLAGFARSVDEARKIVGLSPRRC